MSLATDTFGHYYRLYRAGRRPAEQFRADPRFTDLEPGGSTNGEVIVAGNLACGAEAPALIRFVNARRGSVRVSYGCAIAGDASRSYRVLRAEAEPSASATTPGD